MKIPVCIVGAGISGLACSHYLKKNGIDSVILEASMVYGGRIAELKNYSDFSLDLGGEEVYNQEGENVGEH